jgi:excisionase family DNA binding protein
MKEMLSVNKAALYLNVSEMSIRRWSTDGKLKCYRIGKKRERRFRIEDLQAFLHKDEDLRSIINDTYKIPGNAHISHFYKSEEDCISTGTIYIKESLDRGEIVLVIYPEYRSNQIRHELEQLGILVHILEDQGILNIFEGKSSPKEQSAYVKQLIEKSATMNGFSLIGDMVWTRQQGWDIHSLEELENLTNIQRKEKKALFFCQYDVKEFSRDELYMAMRTHTHTIYHSKLNTSPYYGIPASMEPAS